LGAGALGGVIWVLIAYATHRELGIIAWGIGALTGFAVAMAAGDRAGTGSGILAAGLAFGVILASKFVLALLFVNQMHAQFDNPTQREAEGEIVVMEARALVEEQEKKGAKLKWPPGQSLETAEELSDFPEGIAKQAQKNVDAQTPRIKEHKKTLQQLTNIGNNPVGRGFIVGLFFLFSFGLFDILWFFLATGSAFRLGRGS
jgi:hypothetical protein